MNEAITEPMKEPRSAPTTKNRVAAPSRRFFRPLLQAAAIFAATTVSAQSLATNPTGFTSGLQPLSPVAKVAGIEEIGSIEVLDANRLSFQVNRAARYLVTFTPACTLLPYAQNISMSYDRGTLYAGFDSVEADGQACRINEIFRL